MLQAKESIGVVLVSLPSMPISLPLTRNSLDANDRNKPSPVNRRSKANAQVCTQAVAQDGATADVYGGARAPAQAGVESQML